MYSDILFKLYFNSDLVSSCFRFKTARSVFIFLLWILILWCMLPTEAEEDICDCLRSPFKCSLILFGYTSLALCSYSLTYYFLIFKVIATVVLHYLSVFMFFSWFDKFTLFVSILEPFWGLIVWDACFIDRTPYRFGLGPRMLELNLGSGRGHVLLLLEYTWWDWVCKSFWDAKGTSADSIMVNSFFLRDWSVPLDIVSYYRVKAGPFLLLELPPFVFTPNPWF